MLGIGRKPSPEAVRRWKRAIDLAKVEMGVETLPDPRLKTLASRPGDISKRRRA